MPFTATTIPVDGHLHVEQILEQERLMRADAEHRLGNLLQFVSANLERAARQASEPQARIALGSAAEQVTSIGLLHRSLDHAPSSAREGAIVRLRSLCASLETLVLGPSGHALAFEVHASAQDMELSSELARRLALIVTELIINAAKHAFPDKTSGQVMVEVLRRDDAVACVVRDDGAGALPDRDCELSKGMRIADMLASQAGGHCRWLFTRAGTVAEVLLPLKPPRPTDRPGRIGPARPSPYGAAD